MKRVAPAVGALLLALGSVAVAMAATIAVHAGNFYFEDASVGDGTITATVGDQLRVFIDDAGGGIPHTVEIDELGVHSGPLLVGSTYTTPVLTQPGSFQLFCRNHLRRGHVTTLIVTGTAFTTPPTPTPPPAPTPPPSSSGPADASVPGSALPDPSDAVGGSPSGEESASASADPSPVESADGELPPGVVGPGAPAWHRSVWVGLLALVPIAGAALLTAWRAARRPIPR